MIFISGCGTTKKVYVDKPVYVTPDEWMLEDVENPKIQGQSNEALVNAYLDRGFSITECNARLGALRYLNERVKELEKEKSPD